jgi:hypothetical protein
MNADPKHRFKVTSVIERLKENTFLPNQTSFRLVSAEINVRCLIVNTGTGSRLGVTFFWGVPIPVPVEFIRYRCHPNSDTFKVQS